MTPHYADDWLTVYHGDARAVMAELPAESVHCVVTSPPYWGLRDYGTASWIGGDEACDHAAAKKKTRYDYALDSSPIQQASRTGTDAQVGAYLPECPKCGAIRQDSQLGLEPTPEQYVENMVAVFREVRRVLRSDGTVWLNLGDSYNTAQAGNTKPTGISQRNGRWDGGAVKHGRGLIGGLKPKDLVGIPWRVAFALQADGWYLRSDIIWSKPNPMPESVTDRPTKSHEYMFLLSKSARYYYDADAVREPWKPNAYDIKRAAEDHPGYAGKNDDPKWSNGIRGVPVGDPSTGRNIRSVWSIATQPYAGAHFAVFPPKLVEPCIKAGSPEGGVVLDCFAGSGTTGMVAQSLSRRAILIDLSLEYLGQLMERNRDVPLGI